MLDFIGTIVLVAVIALNISVFSSTIPVRADSPCGRRRGGHVVGLAAACAAAGYFANTAAPFPVIGVFVAFPLVAAGIAAIFSPAARATLLAIPMQTLVGLNIARVLGGFFLLLALADRLGGPFSLSAGWGDVITGLFAVPVMRLAISAPTAANGKIALWNAFGTLDLIAAVALGVVSANGSPLQLIHAGAGSATVLLLPWSLIPTVLVPFYLITHGIVFAQLRARRIGAASAGALNYG